MPDLYLSIRYSESLRLDSTPFQPVTGTITLATVKVTLRDVTGAIAGGLSNTDATGFINTASAAPYAWHLINPAGLTLPVPSGMALYTLEFLATDSTGQKYESVLGIALKADGT